MKKKNEKVKIEKEKKMKEMLTVSSNMIYTKLTKKGKM